MFKDYNEKSLSPYEHYTNVAIIFNYANNFQEINANNFKLLA